MISPYVALAYFGWRLWSGVRVIAGRHSAPARVEVLPAQVHDDDPRFAKLSGEAGSLGFARIGDFEVRTSMGAHSKQRTFVRAFLSEDRSAFAVVYELVGLTVTPQARAGPQKVWAELGKW